MRLKGGSAQEVQQDGKSLYAQERGKSAPSFRPISNLPYRKGSVYFCMYCAAQIPTEQES